MCVNLEKILEMKKPFGLLKFTYFSVFELKKVFHELVPYRQGQMLDVFFNKVCYA